MTLYLLMKYLVTAVLVVIISEVARKHSLFGAIIASLPIVSVLAILWMYVEERDVTKVIDFSTSIVWLVLPSLILFIVLPVLLKRGWNFYFSMAIGCAATIGGYFAMIHVLGRLGLKL